MSQIKVTVDMPMAPPVPAVLEDGKRVKMCDWDYGYKIIMENSKPQLIHENRIRVDHSSMTYVEWIQHIKMGVSIVESRPPMGWFNQLKREHSSLGISSEVVIHMEDYFLARV